MVGLELNVEALRIARQRGLEVHGYRIERFAAENPAAFDAVCSSQILEHVPDVASFVKAACAALKPRGKLILGVPNNNPFLYKYDRLHALNLPPHHMGLSNQASLSRIAQVFPLDLNRDPSGTP